MASEQDNVVSMLNRKNGVAKESPFPASTAPAPDPTRPPTAADHMLVIFHHNCMDGFGAAWCVRRAAQQHHIPLEIISATYGQPIPKLEDYENRVVVIVDFSYPRALLEAMAQKAKAVIVLDHHKTAEQDLAGLPKPMPFRLWGRDGYAVKGVLPQLLPGILPLAAHFDMQRSGAGMAWDFFCSGPRPFMIDQIEDRDLWRFKFRTTREIGHYLSSFPLDFNLWDQIAAAMEDRKRRESMVDAGQAIMRRLQKDMMDLLSASSRRVAIAGHQVPIANMPPSMASEAGNFLAKDEPFAATYFDRADGMRVVSLRSEEKGLDVSEIAKQYGGGGHKHAAGFTVHQTWSGDEVEGR